MFRLIIKIFIGLLIIIANVSYHTKYLLLCNQICMIQPTLNNLHPNEHTQEFHYYPFAVKLDRCVGSCNTLNYLSNKVRVPNKTEDLNLRVFHMVAGINETKTLTKYVPCQCKCKFDERKCNSDKWWNNDKYGCECKMRHVCKKIIFGILLHVVVKMENI